VNEVYNFDWFLERIMNMSRLTTPVASCDDPNQVNAPTRRAYNGIALFADRNNPATLATPVGWANP
jgi:hypothetical protein